MTVYQQNDEFLNLKEVDGVIYYKAYKRPEKVTGELLPSPATLVAPTPNKLTQEA